MVTKQFKVRNYTLEKNSVLGTENEHINDYAGGPGFNPQQHTHIPL